MWDSDFRWHKMVSNPALMGIKLFPFKFTVYPLIDYSEETQFEHLSNPAFPNGRQVSSAALEDKKF